MAQDIKYTLSAHLADNTVTKDDTEDKILSLIINGTADKERILAEMMAVNPGLEEETLRHVLDLENRVIIKLLLGGMRVNNGLFIAEARAKGIILNNQWDSSRNTLYVGFTQGKELREAIGQTNINIVGEKSATMYIAGGEDTATRATGFTATAGRAFTVTGSKLKVVGDDPSVGIKLTDEDGTETEITQDLWVVNDPSKVTFIIPANMEDGVYTLTITTQYSVGATLKTPRSVSKQLIIGEAPAGGGSTPGGGTGGGGDDSEDPMG